MFDILKRSRGRVIGVRARGHLHHEDYESLLPKLEELTARYGQVRLLFDMDGFKGADLHAMWDDFLFGLHHWRDLELLAVVGDSVWERFLAQAIEEFHPGETRYFDLSREDEAWTWLETADGPAD
ncbi:STAS/SEC14 domain-containing protein [Magnetospira sp. QH-2]|uniref:STAS/SEC14 domain-containing protein n=1 Tax=Magnetospira sp. (strain QH-2) TaxID=1288970 RepID=UPI0003E80C43|nr:STAS/SEC14 domain-containing protein [Magnetospira sp. QH-2]CCQ72119.1 conserved protein of unknown function [Magnetospira sp. QH-2]